ncbi:E3 ubiquitin-protein ligase RAD18-like [Xenia sp. Carnegie-2017]|uniref:E3 ubiquitin-protein ligase RAD18-like n=1 Tax=Xenia sp. Carnegie-2017 TaxID=2897299 RepID=UPI001F046C9F|nr:E3 ubiquitin-protein ligase RAD18-like [Xenia sp. Carnegie-2017]XP_046840166.1 E3 ubiquitin-protein ligase RAD18-like [Xenia sp. Carnegie-2017]
MKDMVATISSARDWPWKDMQTIDSLLRCSICGEFFTNTNFIPSCSHNYCSLCIRNYLNVDSKCPMCGVPVQDSQLRNNRIIDEIVKSFTKIRNDLLQLLKSSSSKDTTRVEVKSKTSGNETHPCKKGETPRADKKYSHKRNRQDSSCSSSSNEQWSPSLQHKKLRNLCDDSSDTSEELIQENNKKGSQSYVSKQKKKTSCRNEEDLISCPVCELKMPQSRINLHLDSCLGNKHQNEAKTLACSSKKSEDKETHGKSAVFGANSLIPLVKGRKPMNKLVYKLLSNTELKRKMKEHGLSIKEDRQTLVKRHQQFTIMYNSECGKEKPKSVGEIVRVVEEEEKKKKRPTEFREKLNFDRVQGQEEIDKMKRDYMAQNESQFTSLVNQIRNRKKKNEAGASGENL